MSQSDEIIIYVGDYMLGKLIGRGAFGSVYEGVSKSNDVYVAIKLEIYDLKHPQLEWEYHIYNLLYKMPDYPRVMWYGVCQDYCVLILERLGNNMESLSVCGDIDIRKVLLIAIQMMSRICDFHSIGYIHRDIKPQNILTGNAEDGYSKNTIYLIDYGLAKQFCTKEKGHILDGVCENGVVGTPQYMSINSHSGRETSRRDDMEAIGYVLLYLAVGDLPWMDFTSVDDVLDSKINTSISTLCGDLPPSFRKYMRTVRKLRFDERPNYIQLRKDFIHDFHTMGFRDKAIV